MADIEKVLSEIKSLLAVRNSPNSTSSSSPSEIRWRIVQPHDGAISMPEIENEVIRKIQDIPHENTKSFTPKIISIGPLHHGKPELQPMENVKHKFLNDHLNRRYRYGMIPSPSRDGRNEELLRRFITAAIEMEEGVRSCYVLPRNTISSDDFVKMLVIDGCFLLELFIKRSSRTIYDEDLGPLPSQINHEILLFENQIPFFVLEEFYKIHLSSKMKNGEANTNTIMKIASDYVNRESTTFFSSYDMLEKNFEEILQNFLKKRYTKQGSQQEEVVLPHPTENLLHFYHNMILFKHQQHTPINLIRKWTMTIFSWLFKITSYPMFLIHQLLFAKPLYRTRPTTAMELEEAGVRFQGSAMGLWFEQGTFFIPVLSLDDQNLCILKNLLAFEFYYPKLVDPVVHMYVAMLFQLIKKPEDLKVLEKHHIIITRCAGEESFRLIRDLLKSVADYETFEINRIINEQLGLKEIKAALMAYCEKPRHRWRAKLMKDYFGSPWSILGLFVGIFLLVLTALQTVFTMLSYYN